MTMILNAFVEGQAEEMFVKDSIHAYLIAYDIHTNPVIVSTKRQRDGVKFKGGLSNFNFGLFKSDLKKLIDSTPHGLVTTIIDYYALPTHFPKYDERVSLGTQIEKVEFLENALWEEMGSPANFIPYIQLHEFEALLFSDRKGFEANVSRAETLNGLCAIIDEFENPEDINEGSETAPSKRIRSIYPSYEKVVEGNIIISDIGIETIKAKCPHFSSWLDKIVEYRSKKT